MSATLPAPMDLDGAYLCEPYAQQVPRLVRVGPACARALAQTFPDLPPAAAAAMGATCAGLIRASQPVRRGTRLRHRGSAEDREDARWERTRRIMARKW